MRYLLDTATCIDAFRGHPQVIPRLQACHPDDCAISTISAYELLVGVHKCRQPAQEMSKVQTLLDELHELAFDRRDAAVAGHTRAALESRGMMIGPYDLLIASQALSRSLTVVTSNDGEFGRVDGLHVENWRS